MTDLGISVGKELPAAAPATGAATDATPDDDQQTGQDPGQEAGQDPGQEAGQETSQDPGQETGQDPGQGAHRSARPDSAAAMRLARKLVVPLLALLLYGGLSLALFGPWILNRMSTFFLSAQPQDGSLFIWAFKWWPFAIGHHYSAMFSYAAWAPSGINLTWATTVPGPALALQSLTHSYGPMFTFNVVELAAPALAAWTAYLLCRRITRSFFPALIGGFFFGFSPSLIDELGQGHPSLTLVFLVPVCAYLVVRLLEGSIHPLLYAQLLGVVLGIQLYVGEEIFATMTLVGSVCALIGFAAGPAERRRRLLRAVAPTAGAYAIAAVIGIPLLFTLFTRPRIVKAIHYATIQYGAKGAGDFLRYVTPGRYTDHWGMFVARWGDNPWYLGAPLIAVIILFAVTEWRRRATWTLVAGLLLLLALSLGDVMPVFGARILPWRLFASLPVLSVAQPGRLVTYAYLVIAVVVARWLKRRWQPPPAPSPYPPSSPLWRPTPRPRPPRSWRSLRWLLVVLAGVTILPAFSSDIWAQSVPAPKFLTTGAYRHAVPPGKIVWVVEVHPDRQLVWQAETNFYFRLAGGFFGGTPPGVRDAALQEELASGRMQPDTSIADIRSFLAAHKVSVIITAEIPWWEVRKIQAATGHWGYPRLHVRVFHLGDRFTNPARAGQPIRTLFGDQRAGGTPAATGKRKSR